MTESEWAKSLHDKEVAWSTEIKKKEEGWSAVIADGGGPGTHKVGEHYDPVKGRMVGEYAAGDDNTSFWGVAGKALKSVAGVVGTIFGGPAGGAIGKAVSSAVPGASDLVNSVKSSDIYQTGSSFLDAYKQLYPTQGPQNYNQVAPKPIQNVDGALVAPQLPNGSPYPVNNINNPSQSYIEKNYGMAILGAGLVVMYFMFKKGRK